MGDTRPGQWDAFTDPKTEVEAAAQGVRDAYWQISRVRRFVWGGQIAGGSSLSVRLSEMERRLASVINDLEILERHHQNGVGANPR